MTKAVEIDAVQCVVCGRLFELSLRHGLGWRPLFHWNFDRYDQTLKINGGTKKVPLCPGWEVAGLLVRARLEDAAAVTPVPTPVPTPVAPPRERIDMTKAGALGVLKKQLGEHHVKTITASKRRIRAAARDRAADEKTTIKAVEERTLNALRAIDALR